MLNHRKQKRFVIILSFVAAALIGPLVLLPEERSGLSRLADLASLLVFSLLILSWCYFDSLERGKGISTSFRIAIIIFGLFTLCFYLVRSRGFARGLKAIGMFLLLLIALTLIMVVSGAIVAEVFHLPLQDV